MALLNSTSRFWPSIWWLGHHWTPFPNGEWLVLKVHYSVCLPRSSSITVIFLLRCWSSFSMSYHCTPMQSTPCEIPFFVTVSSLYLSSVQSDFSLLAPVGITRLIFSVHCLYKASWFNTAQNQYELYCIYRVRMMAVLSGNCLLYLIGYSCLGGWEVWGSVYISVNAPIGGDVFFRSV